MKVTMLLSDYVNTDKKATVTICNKFVIFLLTMELGVAIMTL